MSFTGVGLYFLDEGVTPRRLRRGASARTGASRVVHFALPEDRHMTLCALTSGEPDGEWFWTDDDVDCRGCLIVLADRLAIGKVALVTDEFFASHTEQAHALMIDTMRRNRPRLKGAELRAVLDQARLARGTYSTGQLGGERERGF